MRSRTVLWGAYRRDVQAGSREDDAVMAVTRLTWLMRAARAEQLRREARLQEAAEKFAADIGLGMAQMMEGLRQAARQLGHDVNDLFDSVRVGER